MCPPMSHPDLSKSTFFLNMEYSFVYCQITSPPASHLLHSIGFLIVKFSLADIFPTGCPGIVSWPHASFHPGICLCPISQMLNIFYLIKVLTIKPELNYTGHMYSSIKYYLCSRNIAKIRDVWEIINYNWFSLRQTNRILERFSIQGLK